MRARNEARVERAILKYASFAEASPSPSLFVRRTKCVLTTSGINHRFFKGQRGDQKSN